MEMHTAVSSPPIRVFLDTCLLRVIVKYGEFIWDGGDVPEDQKFFERADALRDLVDLRFLCLSAQRYGLPWLVTEKTMVEIARSPHDEDVIYALDMLAWAQESHPRTSVVSPKVIERAERVEQKSLAGRLGKGDQTLLKEAILSGCDAFLTWELKLPKLSDSIFKQTKLLVCTPHSYANLLQSTTTLLS